MDFTCLTLFPEMILFGLSTSVTGKAIQKGLLSVNAVNIRDYTDEAHGSVDDYTYGGGAGMLIQAQPVYNAYKAVAGSRKIRTVYVTPQGKTFTQRDAYELSGESEIIFLCGHYEGIDERVLEEIVTDYYSIGDYVLTGGELPAMVMMDAISRYVPGVLGNETSADMESFHNDLLEYPQYSRPEIWHEKKVPGILLSGNHNEIVKWRLEKSIERTKSRRPDLYEKYLQKEKVISRLLKKKRNNINMIESLKRGLAEILYDDGKNLLLYNWRCRQCYLDMHEFDERIIAFIPEETDYIILQNGDFLQEIMQIYDLMPVSRKYIACYTSREQAGVRYKSIEKMPDESYKYCALKDERVIGTIRQNEDGSMGVPKPEYGECSSPCFDGESFNSGLSEHEIMESLTAYLINRQKEQGYTPYIYFDEKDLEICDFVSDLGMYSSDGQVIIFKNSLKPLAHSSILC